MSTATPRPVSNTYVIISRFERDRDRYSSELIDPLITVTDIRNISRNATEIPIFLLRNKNKKNLF